MINCNKAKFRMYFERPFFQLIQMSRWAAPRFRGFNKKCQNLPEGGALLKFVQKEGGHSMDSLFQFIVVTGDRSNAAEIAWGKINPRWCDLWNPNQQHLQISFQDLLLSNVTSSSKLATVIDFIARVSLHRLLSSISSLDFSFSLTSNPRRITRRSLRWNFQSQFFFLFFSSSFYFVLPFPPNLNPPPGRKPISLEIDKQRTIRSDILTCKFPSYLLKVSTIFSGHYRIEWRFLDRGDLKNLVSIGYRIV